MGVATNDQKVDFVRSCAGFELTELWDKEVRVRFEAIPVNGDNARLEKHTYDKIKNEAREYSSLTYSGLSRARRT